MVDDDASTSTGSRPTRSPEGGVHPAIRDRTLDSDGVAGEVIFADGDSVTAMEAPPFGAGLQAGMITDPRLAWGGARAHNRWLAEFCATNPPRRAGVALVPITHGIEESVQESRLWPSFPSSS